MLFNKIKNIMKKNQINTEVNNKFSVILNNQLEKNKLKSLYRYILNQIPKFIYKIYINKNQIILYTYSTYLNNIVFYLKNHYNTQFKLLMDICAVDYPNKKNRFEIVYNFLSIKKKSRIIVKIVTNETLPVPSVTHQFNSAGWYEREVWDMFGVYFSNNLDLRRILTDYGFEGFPLRRDFPLSGYVELRYDDEKKRIISESLELTQEFRHFNLMNPWKKYIN